MQTRARFAPISIVAGMSVLCQAVPSVSRAKCGTASPMKAIGPQKAVVVAVSRPVTSKSICLTLPILMPCFLATDMPRTWASG